jgi:hemerythrin-like domain-containing protein
MPVTLGAGPDQGFDDPIGLLGDCHRRIERFLNVLVRIAAENADGRLRDEHRPALDTALRYFREAAPRHTADEDRSLFPRMRTSGHPEAAAVMAALEQLEHEHGYAAALHARVDHLGRRWLERGRLEGAEHRRFSEFLGNLRGLYEAHIALEDGVLFPAAARALGADQLREIGREMAARRSVPAGGPPVPPAARPVRPGAG